MNQLPPGPDLPDDVDERYRRASALDRSRPGETVQRAVLAHAARLAAERATQDAATSERRAAATPSGRWRRPAVLGTLAAAALAAVLVAPRFLAPPAAPAVVETPVAPSARSDLPPAPAAAPPAPGRGRRLRIIAPRDATRCCRSQAAQVRPNRALPRAVRKPPPGRRALMRRAAALLHIGGRHRAALRQRVRAQRSVVRRRCAQQERRSAPQHFSALRKSATAPHLRRCSRSR